MRIVLAAAALACGILLLPQAATSREVWQATRMLMPGDTLRADDAKPLELPPSRERPGLIAADRPVVGLEVKQRIAAGAALSERDIGARDLVRASQPVRVLWKTGGITLELQGRALESGPAGAEVRVSNPRSGRTIRAIVVAEGTAEIKADQGDEDR